MMSNRRESGQAAVESAIVLPLVVFLILGTMQLFMMLQARIMAEYGAYRATRAGSINHGNCDAMNHAAIASVLPTFTRTNDLDSLVAAFDVRKDNRFGPTTLSNGKDISNEAVVWIFREAPLAADVGDPEDLNFDSAFGRGPMRLETRVVLWFPLRIPFADWVITRMMLAHYGMKGYNSSDGIINPLSPAQLADWPSSLGYTPPPAEMSAYAHARVVEKFQELAEAGKYLFPIQATHTMRMMTPAKLANFSPQNCPPTP